MAESWHGAYPALPLCAVKMRDAQWSEVRIRVLPDLDPLPLTSAMLLTQYNITHR